MSSNVWLIVLNWNGREDTLELLEGLSGEPATIVVVDNGSADGTLDAIHQRFPSIRTLQTGANLGYAGGNNAGLALALAEGAEVIGVLNNDTLVEPGFLSPLLAELADGRSVAVSPDIRYAESPELSWFRGSWIDERTGWPQHLPAAAQPPPDAGPFRSPVLTGCCILATAATWRKVGNFDERLFLNFEDSDWSLRAADLGVALLVVPESRICHKVSRSFTGTAGTLGAYYFVRNGLIFAWRHFGWQTSFRFFGHQVVRPAVRQMSTPNQRIGVVVSLLGVAAAVSGKRGPAGLLVTTTARRRLPRSNIASAGAPPVTWRRRMSDSPMTAPVVRLVRWRRDIWSDLRLRLLAEVGFVPSHALRRYFYRRSGMVLPKTSSVHWRAEFYRPEGIVVGEHCTIGDACFLDGRSGITFGDAVNVGSHVSIYTRQHDVDSPDFEEIGAPVTIGNHAWIASHAVILPGVHIGEGAVVAAGAVVPRDVPPYALVGGNPARVIRQRNHDLRYRLGYAKRFV